MVVRAWVIQTDSLRVAANEAQPVGKFNDPDIGEQFCLLSCRETAFESWKLAFRIIILVIACPIKALEMRVDLFLYFIS